MPLRAKITVPSPAAHSNMSTATESTAPRPAGIQQEFYPLPSDDPSDVVFQSIYGLRTIELNRPSKHNALTASMFRKLLSRLIEWERSDLANVVVVKGAEGPPDRSKAFCAGGDVVELVRLNRADPVDGWRQSARYFELEYKLNHYVATYGKPYVAFMDGITMGGGVGLCMHAPFRVATERTVWAMPETTIGFFPDVGASFFLPRLSGALGRYLGLTGTRVNGADAFFAGVATHYIHSTTLPLLEARLAELRFRDYDDLPTRLRLVADTLDEFASGFPPGSGPMQPGLHRAIDRCFGKPTVPDIVAELERVAREGNRPLEELPRELVFTYHTREWATETAATLRKRSPTSLHVTLRMLDEGRRLTIRGALQSEFRVAAKFMQHPDFDEGVSKLLMSRRPSPAQWRPATLEQAGSAALVTEPFFRREPRMDQLATLTENDYDQYPHRTFGPPTEHWVRAYLESLPSHEVRGPEQATELIVERLGDRQGIREVVRKMIRRCVTFKKDGKWEWSGGQVNIMLDLSHEEEQTT